jgi:lysophospholipase L1-like esterase
MSRAGLAVNVLVSLATVATMLALAEAAARALVSHDLLFLVERQRYHCWQRSPLVGHENKPDCVGRDGEAEIRINSIGLRGPKLRQDGAVRILALGDSCTFGYVVSESASYPAVLQKLLDDRGGPTRYEVLNAGVEGYTSWQGLIYLRERGLALNPAIVIFGYGFNDATRDGDIVASLEQERRFSSFFRLSDWLLDRSTLWAWLLSGEHPKGAARVPPERFEANLREIARLTREHGAKPIAISFSVTQKDAAYGAALQNAAATGDFPVVVYTGPQLDIVHPSPPGYRQLASTLLGRLVEIGYVD